MNDNITKLLTNWTKFNEVLNTLTEDEAKEALTIEVANDNRKSFVERLHQRYNILRTMREREELMRSFN